MRTWARANWLVALLVGVIAVLAVYTFWDRQTRSIGTPTQTPPPASSNEASKSVADATTGVCTKHGTVAWQNDNQLNGALYGEAPIGGLSEPCGVVAQTWTDQGGTERFVFYVPPHTVAWISGHRGGTGWYFDPARDPETDLRKQQAELEQRDGNMKTTVAMLPSETFRLVTRIRSATPSATAVSTPPPSSSTKAPAAPSAPQKPPTTSQVVSGQCNVGGESVGPVIMEGEVNGKATVVKLNAGSTYTLAAGGCFSLPSQSALDARWPDHKAEFLAKYPTGQALEQ